MIIKQATEDDDPDAELPPKFHPLKGQETNIETRL